MILTFIRCALDSGALSWVVVNSSYFSFHGTAAVSHLVLGPQHEHSAWQEAGAGSWPTWKVVVGRNTGDRQAGHWTLDIGRTCSPGPEVTPRPSVNRPQSSQVPPIRGSWTKKGFHSDKHRGATSAAVTLEVTLWPLKSSLTGERSEKKAKNGFSLSFHLPKHLTSSPSSQAGV